SSRRRHTRAKRDWSSDVCSSDLEDSFEKAQQRMLEESATHAIVKANLTNEDIDCFIAGDLINQLTPTNQAASTIDTPYLGLFSACATITESLAIGAMLCNQGHAN